MKDLDVKIENWKNRLLDLGKRNRLINFKETKRSNVAIISPSYDILYNKLVNDEENLKFPFASKITYDEDGEEINSIIIEGDLETNKTINEQLKTLKALRNRARISIEEQGINTLYLTFGMLRWKESEHSDVEISSPIILVPVALTISSITDPYILQLHEDEIVVNPTLVFKFENDFGIVLPEFDAHVDDIAEYLMKIKKIVNSNNWKVAYDVNLTLLSFLKINMYKDIEKNKDKIVSNPIVKALSGDKSDVPLIPSELNNYDHDKNTRPIDTYQVVDADSSQQDAIILSKKGISFVLQGPPGTGKSQTITNIIAEAISEGKKVLFVSEKMAALDVVKNRLNEAGLSDFCLTLHSHKANKKAILNQLAQTLAIQKIKLNDDIIYKLSVLEEKRNKLNEYQKQLHEKCLPLNISIYEANGQLAKLSNTQDIIFGISNIKATDKDLLNKYIYLLTEFSKTIGKLSEDYVENPWYGSNVKIVTHELRHDLEVNLPKLSYQLGALIADYETIVNETGLNLELTNENVKLTIDCMELFSKTPIFPEKWLSEDLIDLECNANEYLQLFNDYNEKKNEITSRYDENVLKLNANEIVSSMERSINGVNTYLNKESFPTNKDIVINADFILNECRELSDFGKALYEQSKVVCTILGINECSSLSSISEIKGLIKLILKNPKPLRNWFEDGKIQELTKLLNDAENEQKVLYNNLDKIRANYDERIIELDINEVFEKFKSTYLDVVNIISAWKNQNTILDINMDIITSFANNQAENLKKHYFLITDAFEKANELVDKIGIEKILTLDGLISLSKLMSVIIRNPKPSIEWFDENKKLVIEKLICEVRETQREIEKDTIELMDKFTKDILSIDYKNMLARFKTVYTGLFKSLKSNYRDDKKIIKGFSKEPNIKLGDSDILVVLNKISLIKEKEQWLIENNEFVSKTIGEIYQGKYTDWEMVNKSRTDFNIIREYFAINKIPDKLKKILINGETEELLTQHSTISKITESNVLDLLQSIFGKDISKKFIEDILINIKNFSNDSIQMKDDCEKILRYSVKNNYTNKVTINEIKEVLTSIDFVNASREWYSQNDSLLFESFGECYNGENTNWDNSKQNLEKIENLFAIFSEKQIPEKLVNFLISNEVSKQNFIEMLSYIKEVTSKDIVLRIDNLTNIENCRKIDINKINYTVESIAKSFHAFYSEYQAISKLSKDTIQFETIIKDINLINKIQEIESKVENNLADLKFKFDFMFNGFETNWDEVILCLKYANNLKKVNEKFGLSDLFVHNLICDKKMSEWVSLYCGKVQHDMEQINSNFQWYAELYDNSKKLYNTSIYKILDRIDRGLNNLTLLEEWIDFRSIRHECREIGLSEFVQKVEEICMSPEIILNTFLKRFYRLWLDAMIPSYPAVQSFRSRLHEETINEFKNLDIEQIKIARLRILARLISRLPNTEIATSAVDEVGILKREITKQRKIMPIRRLFRQIPNLLTSLKPCLMMSPLSVSLFLQADGYNFDMVIFDEASQVCTEDAIGAIMRGKQIIIAGDSKQLPPTNFFTATTSDSDFDDESDDIDDSDAYDSILEEVVNVLPERTLKWHYRSRHEHLIAFSNAKIYNNQLITFPSYLEKIPDIGVEYIYVENGIYDRSGKKHNLNEAKRVANLVFEHIRKFPNRSLGVVTFSSSQQQAIESAVRQLRLKNSNYEKFFSEEVEQPFFIKNLENVQGDERDTIIFSIGYAKDQNGIMYMNFGPLSRSGGYRRLNVAITRAKYNIKLVGSIHPTDINIENTNSEGVKMLRQYIEFAINGDSILKNESNYTDFVNVESPFEEAVYDFLVKNGYNVKTQVGCSGYRIDMAVKHPTISGVFVLGIECDGATYHSSRTARERDRLRQSVLEDIGWNIYRIWSTDWIKDTKTEGRKLLDAVEKAISKYKISSLGNETIRDNKKLSDEIGTNNDMKSLVQTYMTTEKIKDNSVLSYNPYGFDYYEETDIDEILKIADKSQYLANVISFVVEKEGPIHFELLCKRVASLFGNQKATIKVRNSVEHIINNYLEDTVEINDDFCWHKNINKIKVKIPSQYAKGRPINYISTEELAEAIKTIVGKSFGIAQADLLIAAARVFGFNRTSEKITTSMGKACMNLIEKGIIKEIDGKIVI